MHIEDDVSIPYSSGLSFREYKGYRAHSSFYKVGSQSLIHQVSVSETKEEKTNLINRVESQSLIHQVSVSE